MTTYTDNYGGRVELHNVYVVVLAAGQTVVVPPGSVVLVDGTNSGVGDLSQTANSWSSATGGPVTFYDANESCDQYDDGGGTIAANTADHTAL